MSNALYSRPSDNVAANATITASAADAAYPATNIADLNPAKPAKLSTTSGNWKFAFGAVQRVDIVAIIHHNLTAGLEVRIQSSAVSDFSVLQVNELITIPAYHEDAFPVCPFLDLTDKTNYSASGHQYWRVLIVGVNAAPVAIGEVLLITTKRTLSENISWGDVQEEEHPVVEHRTDHGVSTIVGLGTKWRTVSGEIDATDAGAAALLSLKRDARGRAKSFLFVLDPSVNDAWMARLVNPKLPRQSVAVNRSLVQSLAIEEISRGLPL